MTMALKRKRSIESKDLDNLTLALKLKALVAEACLSDMNSVVIEKNLIAIAKEMAVLCMAGLQSEERCLRFLQLCFERMEMLMKKIPNHSPLTVQPDSLWANAKWQVNDDISGEEPKTLSEECYANAKREVNCLWKAMVLSREQGAKLWHENKQEEAIQVLKTSEVYMRRFHLKYQKLNIDHALLLNAMTFSMEKKSKKQKTVSFAATPTVLGSAEDIDRSPTMCSKPTKLDALLLRSSRNFPTPMF
ncbi:hypothetical protein THRCLA_08060 [Thraustotheca clavata]|uniref:Uncharacterized protein n=1 Tax=Thraustotheca clavata TaxID=74557 RepID=A0A1V9ZAF6_9STRA|nr:hypothetical protein THRCLA_08060 [Thraustotheca clavata]